MKYVSNNTIGLGILAAFVILFTVCVVAPYFPPKPVCQPPVPSPALYATMGDANDPDLKWIGYSVDNRFYAQFYTRRSWIK